MQDPPALLYVKGDLLPQDQRCIAVIGTRQSSLYGNEMAEKISRELARHGFTVISGLARGIDTAAHRGALQGGRTLAVIGSGLANIYPAENKQLAEEIAGRGALISEFSLCVPPDRQNFPQRNRIVAGLALASVLIEAPLKSGAMITIHKANEYKRKLFALPGRADTGQFKGNHALIKSGQAELIEDADDILAYFEQLPLPQVQKTQGSQLFDQEERQVLGALLEECSIEHLAVKSGLPMQQLNRVLMGLILKRAVKEFPGKIYKKVQ
jgi:DNA processing protein